MKNDYLKYHPFKSVNTPVGQRGQRIIRRNRRLNRDFGHEILRSNPIKLYSPYTSQVVTAPGALGFSASSRNRITSILQTRLVETDQTNAELRASVTTLEATASETHQVLLKAHVREPTQKNLSYSIEIVLN
jgi:hypothetical protein